MTPAQKRHLQQLIDYNWNDERHDYQINPDSRHIFHSLVALDNLLSGSENKASDFVEVERARA